jgi:uncharacterized membrane protein YeaQ/YmgE (transglycosylase-associated protein family)
VEVESFLWFLIVLAVFGLIVGAIGRLLVPGPTPMGLLGTMAAGVAGALIGGFVGRVLFGPRLTQGWIWVLSILGATLVVALVSRRGAGYGRRRALLPERSYGAYREPATYREPRSYHEPMVHDVDDRRYRPRRRRFF